MKIAICDDSQLEREIIKKYCTDAGEYNISLFSSGEDFLNCTETFDLLFLDIVMGQISGIDIMRTYETLHSQMMIVFITSHNEKSLETHGRNVIHFLTKPVTSEAIKYCINKVRIIFQKFQIVTINNTNIHCGDILYLKSEPPYTVFYTLDHKNYFSSASLNKWEQFLKDFSFCRINRSYIVNFQNTKEIQLPFLILVTGEHLTISRRRGSSTFKEYKEYKKLQLKI